MSTEKKLTHKQKLIIAGSILLVLVVIGVLFYYNGRAAGKRKGSINVSTTPTDPGSGNTASSSQTEINTIASLLHTDMNGLPWTGHDTDPWERWTVLSDTDFIRVSNRFNELYQKESGETMKQWVEGEGWGGAGALSKWKQLRDIALVRMDKLHIV